MNRQFENRLFDRDTLLLCHYDVNFLFIVSLYGRDNKSRQSAWREYVRSEFRKRIQATLNSLYEFRTIQPRKGMDCYQYIKDNFHQLNGKLYRPRKESNYLVLALMKEEIDETKTSPEVADIVKKTKSLIVDDHKMLDNIKSHFHVSDPFKLDADLSVDFIENVGTLEKLPSMKPKNVFTGLVRKK